jgi:thiamine biosynthesis lipoprotein
MRSFLQNPVTERAQPWLGTIVSIRADGPQEAISAAFEEVALIHRLMSFHDAASDISRLNRAAHERPVEVHPYTLEVLDWALRFAAVSEGCFDISVGAELVEWGLLPYPAGATQRPDGTWRGIELLSDGSVFFQRPLWVDLGGIAKGFAVDRAMERLLALGTEQAVVNAGGDIRVHGLTEPVRLSAETAYDTMPVLELTNESVASSSGHLQRREILGTVCGPHVDGARRKPAPTNRFVCVLAEQCIVADALTKVVMAEGPKSASILQEFAAAAYIHDPDAGWQYVGPSTELRGAEKS